jgi:DNA-binding MarR family transcriptional regulator
MASAPSPGLGFLLKRAQHAYRTRIDGSLRPLGLTAPQYAVLSAVSAEPGASSAYLARAAFVTPQTMQGILVAMARDGLLARIPQPQHGRVLATTLTRKGEDYLRQARHHVEEVENLLADAAGEEKAMLADLLSRAAQRLSE